MTRLKFILIIVALVFVFAFDCTYLVLKHSASKGRLSKQNQNHKREPARTIPKIDEEPEKTSDKFKDGIGMSKHKKDYHPLEDTHLESDFIIENSKSSDFKKWAFGCFLFFVFICICISACTFFFECIKRQEYDKWVAVYVDRNCKQAINFKSRFPSSVQVDASSSGPVNVHIGYPQTGSLGSNSFTNVSIATSCMANRTGQIMHQLATSSTVRNAQDRAMTVAGTVGTGLHYSNNYAELAASDGAQATEGAISGAASGAVAGASNR